MMDFGEASTRSSRLRLSLRPFFCSASVLIKFLATTPVDPSSPMEAAVPDSVNACARVHA